MTIIINTTLIIIAPSYENKFIKWYEFNLIFSTKYFFVMPFNLTMLLLLIEH